MKEFLTTLAKTNINNLNNVSNKMNTETNELGNTVGNIISAIIGILGLACVIIVIIGGVQYMTSSGDSGKVKKAKDTILYGVIGMVICVLSFAITQFIITAINGS